MLVLFLFFISFIYFLSFSLKWLCVCVFVDLFVGVRDGIMCYVVYSLWVTDFDNLIVFKKSFVKKRKNKKYISFDLLKLIEQKKAAE